ncbi:MAG: ATP synthase F1 subunit gamma [Planctomycetes bacterium]|nr:ATP synthase F1 subunit gamma [Planctomycetota bacterium]
MANRKVLLKRRKTARNICKITRTMQLIATARFQAALARTTATKPYTEKLAELVGDLSEAAEGIDHPLMETHDDVKRHALVVISTQRGFCGGYNANVLKVATAHENDHRTDGSEVDVHMVGNKGIGFYRFLKRPMVEQIKNISDSPRFDEVEPIANQLMDRFCRGEIASAHVAYMRFISTAKQQATVMQLLPLSRETTDDQTPPASATKAEYEFSPEPKELLDELLPATVRARLFQCFTDATVSEQIARMVAMKAATDAASDMITLLTRQYNRARQTQITMELLDIVGGANAIA